MYDIKQWFNENTLTMNSQKIKYLLLFAYQVGFPHLGNLKIDAGTSVTKAEFLK